MVGSAFDIFQYNATNITINASSGKIKASRLVNQTIVLPKQVGYWNISGVFLSASALYWKTGTEVPLSSTIYI